MCGIYGAFSTDPRRPVDGALLEKMGQALAHRGPDGGGTRLAGPIGLGMRRLSIIDLAGGDQPMSNEDGTIWVVFNGEIYNYRSLTADLLARGHRFGTASDTEVLVHLYEEHGARCVEWLRGMFAFAIWDEARGTLFLARDRLGIKPLYYAAVPEGLLFGSELKALLQSPWLPRRLDAAGLVAYLQYGYVPDPGSILQGVSKLPAGHTLLAEAGRAVAPRRYWRATSWFHEGQAPRSEVEAAAALWSKLEDAVLSHLVSDVPVGAFLSGGIDSSTVLAVMAGVAGAPVRTFSVGFSEDGYDESSFARQIANYFGTEHHELRVEPGDLEVLDKLLGCFDEPFADPSAIPTYLVSRLARQHVKVALSGDGGDEIFAGYERYQADHGFRYAGLIADAGLGAPLRALSRTLPVGWGRNTLYGLSFPRGRRYVNAVSLFSDRSIHDLMGDVLGAHLSVLEQSLDATLDPLSRMQDLDIKTYLTGDILTKVDRMSMANSLETRVPLLDHRLVEFACSLPPQLRMQAGTTKYLLKRVLRGRLPAEVLDRPKQGFAVPLEVWFSGQFRGFFRDQLGDGRRLGEIGIAREAVGELHSLFERTGRRDYCDRLWALVVLDRSVARLFGPAA